MEFKMEPVWGISDDDTEMEPNQHLFHDERKYVCDLCYRAFSVKKYLQRHIRTHAPKGKNLVCDVCKKLYSRKDALKRHLLTHTEERPHACYMCTEAFSRKDELSKHLHTHTNSGLRSLYTCYKCAKVFAREDSLKRHLMIHSGDKVHQCARCNKRFSRKDQLVKHSLTHKDTNQKPDEESEKQNSEEQEFVLAKKLKTRLIIHIKTRMPLKVAKPNLEIKCKSEL